jgi:hypothetical protein
MAIDEPLKVAATWCQPAVRGAVVASSDTLPPPV